MAKSDTDRERPSSHQSQLCHQCRDTFEEVALLTCGHFFGQRCLDNYCASRQYQDHMACSFCRESTEFQKNPIKSRPAKVAISGLVDENHNTQVGLTATSEVLPMCNACKCYEIAVSFCDTCNSYMCDKCDQCHRQLTLLFEGHSIVPLKDVGDGKVHIRRRCENGYTDHKPESKHLLLEDCSSQVCMKCVMMGFHDHKFQNRSGFKEELQFVKATRCTTKKEEHQKNFENSEVKSHKGLTSTQRPREDVDKAYSEKFTKLQKYRLLDAVIDALEEDFKEDQDFAALKAHYRHLIRKNSMTLVAKDQVGRLEKVSLTAHTLRCEETDGLLNETTDGTSAEATAKKAQEKKFVTADDVSDEYRDLGRISEQDMKIKPDKSPAVGFAKKVQKKTLVSADHAYLEFRQIPLRRGKKKPVKTPAVTVAQNAACNSFPQLGHISEPNLEITREIDLPDNVSFSGMAKYSDDSVASGYWWKWGVDIIDSSGNIRQYGSIPRDVCYRDVVFQKDKSVFVTVSCKEVRGYSASGSEQTYIHINNDTGSFIQLNCSPLDEILIANGSRQVYIYDPTGSTLTHTVPTRHNMVKQVSATRSGLLVTSSCYLRPSKVTVYDRNGNAGKSLKAPEGECLYADVDDQDRVYVASINLKAGKVKITQYEFEGLNLKPRVKFKEQNLTAGGYRCHLVCLSPCMLALACFKKLYFIKITV